MRLHWRVGAVILLLGLFSLSTSAHTGENTPEIEQTLSPPLQLAHTLQENAYNVVGISALALIVLVAYSIKKKPRKEKIKKMLFVGIAFFAIASNLYLAGATIYTNTVSPTGGPVHWHTDYELWSCGERMDLIDPTGIDNRVGTWEVHEHNDDRMHIEGTILNMEQATFHHFFETVGSTFDEKGIVFPSTHGNIFIPREGVCQGKKAELQAFLYRVTNPSEAKQWKYTQTKLGYPFDTIMAPYSSVPSGDCLIIEYDVPKAQTDKRCASYDSAENRGEFNGR